MLPDSNLFYNILQYSIIFYIFHNNLDYSTLTSPMCEYMCFHDCMQNNLFAGVGLFGWTSFFCSLFCKHRYGPLRVDLGCIMSLRHFALNLAGTGPFGRTSAMRRMDYMLLPAWAPSGGPRL